MEKPKLLIVDDDEAIRLQLKWALAEDFTVFLAGDRPQALEVLKAEQPGVVTLDLGLPPHPQAVEEGFRTLSDILQQVDAARVIIITGRAEKAHALEAIGQGAYDFFYKPIQVDELKVVLRRAFQVYRLEQEYRALQRQSSPVAVEEILGASPKMQQVFATLRKLATTDVPVLIMGESGTGKELVARAIHRQSARKDGPFIVINCSAIPETLLESELFGYEKGAFTGAHIQQKGRLESAQGGTLLLDEIGELSLTLQVKLLRFLQDHQVWRIGGRQPIGVDVRVIAATNVDLKQAGLKGSFREDLYYRLGVVTMALPPLRERDGDILFLAKALLQRYAAEHQKRIVGFTQQALRALEIYRWPGNVRELENKIKRAVIMAEGPRLTPDDLEVAGPSDRYGGLSLRAAREALERELIQRALARHNGNIARAARDLGISRPALYELLEKLGVARA